jgi:hypothetical protein
MGLWKFNAYVSEGEVNQPSDWLRAQDERARAAVRDVLLLLGNRPSWRNHPYYLDLTREHDGMGEIRIPVGSKPNLRRLRLFGLRDQVSREFLIVVSFEKFKGRPTMPPDAETLALELKTDVELKKGKTVPYEYN